jgi:hypothetical protein
MTLDELEALLEKATPGPFTVRHNANASRLYTVSYEFDVVSFDYWQNHRGPTAAKQYHNAVAFAALRNEAPKLIAAARENERLREALKEMVDEFEGATYDMTDGSQSATRRQLCQTARAALKETQT